MTIRFISNPRAWSAVLLLPLWTSLAHAQATASPTPAATPADTAPAPFRSAFQDYQPFTDEKTVPWKQANDTAGWIGGWREYAKEASRPEPALRAPGAAAQPDPHAGHTKP